uniref:Reverse transcriptase N-terminal domain-containing protein n=1 Tax=Laurencieae sp. TaxID=2007162 RepID=A0A1Z1M2Z3_9FLOR|nr:hypothetical protein [Laurencieae sp.]
MHLRVLMIQKQIYLATKRHKLYYVYQLQKYLINSNEAKIVSVKNIINDTIIHYNGSKSSEFVVDNSEEYVITKVLLKKYLSVNKNLDLVIDKIKQNLIYLSIEPIYRAKLKQNIFKYITNYNNYQSFLVNNQYGYVKNFRLYKNSFIKIIISRLNFSNYISKLVISWLYSRNFVLFFSMYDLSAQYYSKTNDNKLKNTLTSCNNLISLMLNTLVLDICWFLFRTQKKKYYTSNLYNFLHQNVVNNQNFNVNKEHCSISKVLKLFLRNIKYKKYKNIYSLTYQGKLINNLIIIYTKYYQEFNSFIYYQLVTYFNQFINVLLYTCQRKKIDKISNLIIQSSEIVKLNYFFNLCVYYYNILNSYTF